MPATQGAVQLVSSGHASEELTGEELDTTDTITAVAAVPRALVRTCGITVSDVELQLALFREAVIPGHQEVGEPLICLLGGERLGYERQAVHARCVSCEVTPVDEALHEFGCPAHDAVGGELLQFTDDQQAALGQLRYGAVRGGVTLGLHGLLQPVEVTSTASFFGNVSTKNLLYN